MTESLLPPYPKEILPDPTFKVTMDVDELLLRYPDLLVVRMVEGSFDACQDDSENGNPKLLSMAFHGTMANLSMNLAGGLFDTDSKGHLKFLPDSDFGKKQWNGEKIDPASFKLGTYKVYEQCFGLCFYVKFLHRQFFPFRKGFKSKVDYDIYKINSIKAIAGFGLQSYLSQVVGTFEDSEAPVLVNGKIKVHHLPTNANYWHMTLDTYRPDEEDFVRPNEQKNSDRNMFRALKLYLVKHCETNFSPNYRIDPVYYRK